MMLKMMNPFGSVTDSIPGVGGGSSNDDDGESKEEQEEQERLRQEAIKQAEKERREKYKKQEEERESLRQNIRDKYGIEKQVDEDEEEDEDDEDDEGFGSSAKKPEVPDDPVLQAKAMAEQQLNNLKGAAGDKCVVQ